MNLRELYEQHPEWHDLPLVVYREDGLYDYIDGAGMVYPGKDYPGTDFDNEDDLGPDNVLVFSPN